MTFITYQDNGEWLTSGYRLNEDPSNHPRLALLRSREKLDAVVASGQTQFEKIVLLRKWVHNQWSYSGAPFYYPAWDATEILDLERKFGNKGFCAQYAIVFLQACQSLGLHARYIDLPGHFIVGVWSDDYNGWIVMDPMYDLHYEKDGIPLTGRQLCDAYWTTGVQQLFKVDSDGKRTATKHNDLENFRMYSIITDANQLSVPVEVVVNMAPKRKLVRESDYRRYPIIGRDKLGVASSYIAWKTLTAKEFFPGKIQSQDADDFAYRMNQTLLFVARQDKAKGIVKLILWAENEPTFGEFLVENKPGEWTACLKEIIWPLEPAMNHIRVRTKTANGWMTRPSECHIFYKPAWWGLVSLPPASDRLPANIQ